MSSQVNVVSQVQVHHSGFTPIHSPKRNIHFFVAFNLQQTTNMTISYYEHGHDHDVIDGDQAVEHDFAYEDLPLVVSPLMHLNPDDKLSWQRLRTRLHNMGLTTTTSQREVIRYAATYVNEIMKNHLCPTDRSQLGPKNVGLVVNIFFHIHEVLEYHEHVYDFEVLEHHEHVYDFDCRVGLTPTDDMSIRSLKKVRTEDVGVIKFKDEKCSICFEDLVEEEEITCLPCDHAFHGSCIVKWLETSHFCPVCRFELPARELES